jgi:galactose mutarotase-like enzyme
MASKRLHHDVAHFPSRRADGATRAEIVAEFGGIVSSLRLGDRECLFQYPWFWGAAHGRTARRHPAPVPICGRLLQDGVRGHTASANGLRPAHPRFAMRLPWESVAADRPDALRLRLTDTAETRTIYPFAFELDLLYVAAPEGLRCRLAVRNAGAEPLPFYVGFHPYFLTPAPAPEKSRRSSPPGRAGATSTTQPRPISSRRPNRRFFRWQSRTWTSTNSFWNWTRTAPRRWRSPTASSAPDRSPPRAALPPVLHLARPAVLCDEPWMAPPGSLNRPGAARVLPPGDSAAAKSCSRGARLGRIEVFCSRGVDPGR